MRRNVTHAEGLLRLVWHHLYLAEWPLEQLAEMDSSTLANDLPALTVAAKEYAEAKSIVVFVSEVLKTGTPRKGLHALALQADKIRRSQDDIVHLPGRGDVAREIMANASFWFDEDRGSLQERRAKGHLPGLIAGAAKSIALELAKHSRLFKLPRKPRYAEVLDAANRAAEKFSKPPLASRVLARTGILATDFIEVLTLECFVALGLTRKQAGNQLAAIRAEQKRGGLTRKGRC